MVQLEVIQFRFQAFEQKVFYESEGCCPLRFGTNLSGAAILSAWPGPILSCKRHHGSFFSVHSLPQWEHEALLLILFHSSFFACQFWIDRRGIILFLDRLNLSIFQILQAIPCHSLGFGEWGKTHFYNWPVLQSSYTLTGCLTFYSKEDGFHSWHVDTA